MTDNNNAFLRFLPPIEIFNGDDDTKKAEEWISSIKRLKTLAAMNDSFESKFITKFMKNRVIEAWEKIKTVKQHEDQDCSEIVDTLNPLFKTVNLTNNESKISFFIASIKPTIAYELAREKFESKTYEEVTDKAMEIEKLQRKYNVHNSLTQIKLEKKVHFDNTNQGESNNTSGNNYQNGSVSSDGRISADSLSELIEAVNKLNINLVQHSRSNQPYRSSPVPERKPLMCWNCNQPGHPSRLCPSAPGQGNQNNTSSRPYTPNHENDMGKGNGH
ncbi:hypothetical protein A0J61_11248, partial [Choanephora cucurbitarum]